MLVFFSARLIEQQFAEVFPEPLRIALFLEEDRPELTRWLSARPEVELRTEVPTHQFRPLIAADSLDAAWLVTGPAAAAPEIQLFTNTEYRETTERVNRLARAYRRSLLQTRLDSLGVPIVIDELVQFSSVNAGNGLDQLAGRLIGTFLWLALLFGWGTSRYVTAGYQGTRSSRALLLTATAWGIGSALLSGVGLWLGIQLAGSQAVLFANMVGDIFSWKFLLSWLPLLLLTILLGAALFLRISRWCTGYRPAMAWTRFLYLGGLLVMALPLFLSHWWVPGLHLLPTGAALATSTDPSPALPIVYLHTALLTAAAVAAAIWGGTRIRS